MIRETKKGVMRRMGAHILKGVFIPKAWRLQWLQIEEQLTQVPVFSLL
jgi:hypothetical protein